MRVDQTRLAQHLGLPANADESLIKARLRGLEAQAEARAVLASAPARRRVDAAMLRASSNEELRALATSTLAAGDREAVNDEISDRAFMQQHYPDARTASNGRARIHHAA